MPAGSRAKPSGAGGQCLPLPAEQVGFPIAVADANDAELSHQTGGDDADCCIGAVWGDKIALRPAEAEGFLRIEIGWGAAAINDEMEAVQVCHALNRAIDDLIRGQHLRCGLVASGQRQAN